LNICGQATKGAWGMSWRQKTKTGVEDCEKSGVAVKQALIPEFPNQPAARVVVGLSLIGSLTPMGRLRGRWSQLVAPLEEKNRTEHSGRTVRPEGGKSVGPRTKRRQTDD
jgi:hypothetical protein